MELTNLFFYIFGIVAIASAFATIISKNPVVSAMSLVLHFFMLSGIYITLNAQFVAVMQVLVYAGAIMVLVVFVIMLLNLGSEESLSEVFSFKKGVAFILGGVLLLQFVILYLVNAGVNPEMSEFSANVSTVEAIGQELFNNYLFQFEAISLLLLVAIIGALLLAKKEDKKSKSS